MASRGRKRTLRVEGMWPGLITGDGLMFHDIDPARSAASIAQTLVMDGTLGAYDDLSGTGRKGLLDMPQFNWHARAIWNGPSGIDTTRGLWGCVDDQQSPFPNARVACNGMTLPC